MQCLRQALHDGPVRQAHGWAGAVRVPSSPAFPSVSGQLCAMGSGHPGSLGGGPQIWSRHLGSRQRPCGHLC